MKKNIALFLVLAAALSLGGCSLLEGLQKQTLRTPVVENNPPAATETQVPTAAAPLTTPASMTTSTPSSVPTMPNNPAEITNAVSAPAPTPAVVNPPDQAPVVPGNNSNPEMPAPVENKNVNIESFSFSPNTLIIKKGATITWTNNDSVAHSLSFEGFSSSDIQSGQAYSRSFTERGVFNYFCSIHPSMKGSVTVE
jgi:plastocyanin